jgi:hypothetical protein
MCLVVFSLEYQILKIIIGLLCIRITKIWQVHKSNLSMALDKFLCLCGLNIKIKKVYDLKKVV